MTELANSGALFWRVMVVNLVKAAPIRKSRAILAETASACCRSSSSASRHAWCIWLHCQLETSPKWTSLRSDDSTESSPLDDDIPITLPTHIRNFWSNMFSFSITIRPDHDHIRSASFILEVSLDWFQALHISHIWWRWLTGAIKVRILASNSAKGSHDCHCRWSSPKSWYQLGIRHEYGSLPRMWDALIQLLL
jgi:hypothetical protein